MSNVALTGRLVCANDEEEAAVLRHLPRHVELTRAEEGCLAFDVQPTSDRLVWTVSERFADQAAFEAHQARVRASEWGQATAGIVRDYVISTVGH
jgi:quinol monooxygenase YgiN